METLPDHSMLRKEFFERSRARDAAEYFAYLLEHGVIREVRSLAFIEDRRKAIFFTTNEDGSEDRVSDHALGGEIPFRYGEAVVQTARQLHRTRRFLREREERREREKEPRVKPGKKSGKKVGKKSGKGSK